MQLKENDLILNMSANPNFKLGDFMTVGLTSDNTSLQNEDKYLNSPKILENPMFQTNGTFDKAKFHNLYENASIWYNNMSNKDYIELSMKERKIFGRDNIWAPKDLKKSGGPNFSWEKVVNPGRETRSLNIIGLNTPNKKSMSEIAEGQKLLLNPSEAYREDGTLDESKAKWGDPLDAGIFSSAFWKNFTKTQVLATWDEDGEHIDPTTGLTMKHSKGDPKLNSNGTYYYENLDGRDIYGKQVLSKMNILTSEDSPLNKYDFFDSDDKEQKSVIGTTAKNLALVGSMFVPYVGPVVAGLSVFNLSVGLLGTLGKVLTGSDSPTFSAMEGWSKAMNRQTATTEYALQHPWCLENMIGMIGDVVGQFKELRILFKYAPAIFKGKYGAVWENGGEEARKADIAEKYASELERTSKDIIESGLKLGKTEKAIALDFMNSNEAKAVKNLRTLLDNELYIKDYNNIGANLSKAFMTGITVANTYGEAKDLGASDLEASLLTIGYGAGEAAILNTGLGEWLFPELRYEKKLQNAVAETLTKGLREASIELGKKSRDLLEKEGRIKFANKWILKGADMAKDLYTANKSIGSKTIKEAFFNAMGEGLEEVSEEALQDFSKGCFNAVAWLRGDDTRLNTNMYNYQTQLWTPLNLFNDYALNFVGGFVGGGLAGFGLDMRKQNQALQNMTFNEAAQQLTYMCRNNKSDDFLKSAFKQTLGEKRLSATRTIKHDDGTYTWAEGTAEDNLDLAAKLALQKLVDIVNGILESEGLKMSDESFLSRQTDILPELKFSYLQNSATACKFLQEFNTLSTDMVNTLKGIEPVKTSDSQEKKSKDVEKNDEVQANIKNQQLEKVDLLRLLKEALLSGLRAGEFIGSALFEMSPAINDGLMTPPSFVRWAEWKTRRDFNDIPEKERTDLFNQYKQWEKLDKGDLVFANAEIFRNILTAISPAMQSFTQESELRLSDPKVQSLKHAVASELNEINSLDDSNVELWLAKFSAINLSQLEESDKIFLFDEDMAQETVGLWQQIRDVNNDSTLSEDQKIAKRLELSSVAKALATKHMALGLSKIVLPFIELGSIDSPTKTYLLNLIDKVTNVDNGYLNQYEKDFIKNQAKNLLDTINSQLIPIANKYGTSVGELLMCLDQTPNNYGMLDLDAYDMLVDDIGLDIPELLELSSQIVLAREQELQTIANIKSNLLLQKSELVKLGNTPIFELLDAFTISKKDKTAVKISKLVDTIDKRLLGNTDMFSLNTLEVELLEEALNLLGIAHSAVEASKVTSGNLDNLFGYSKTLNEVNHKIGTDGWEDLAEINEATGNLIQLDINNLRSKLLLAKKLNALNSGLKLTEQKRISTNTHAIFYLRLQRFIPTIPDDWEGKEELQLLLDSCKHLKEYAAKFTDSKAKTEYLNSLKEEEHAEIEKEIIKLEDGIYDFFHKKGESDDSGNLSKLKDSSKLKTIFKELNLFDIPSDTITEISDTVDDNSFIWWLVSRAAVRSSDFNKLLASSLSGKYAPIATQRYAIYMNFASAVAGDTFSLFTKAYKEAIRDKWSSADLEDKLKIVTSLATKFGLDMWYSSPGVTELLENYPFLNLICPKYAHIVLTEGVPGCGKTTGVWDTVVTMIKNLPNSEDSKALLRNVVISHGTNKQSAELIAGDKGLNIEGAKVFSRDELMNFIRAEKEAVITEDTENPGKYIAKKDVFKLTEEGDFQSQSKLMEYSENDIPSLMIIDEITNFNLADLDDLERFADKYGITILVAGDYDLSGVIGNFLVDADVVNQVVKDIDPKIVKSAKESGDISVDGTMKQSICTYSTNFIRSFKMGVSMRSNNSQKVDNMALTLMWVHALDSSDWKRKTGLDANQLKLHYFEDSANLYGDKVLNGNSVSADNLKASIDKIIRSSKEKVGYIYDDESSEVYKILTSPEYKDKITLYKGTSAQGTEGLYYIIDLKHANYLNMNPKRDMYTSITRASQGTLIIDYSGLISNYEMDKETHPLVMSLDGIKNYSEATKKVLEAASTEGKDIRYMKRTKNSNGLEPIATPETKEIVSVPAVAEKDPTKPEDPTNPIPPTPVEPAKTVTTTITGTIENLDTSETEETPDLDVKGVETKVEPETESKELPENPEHLPIKSIIEGRSEIKNGDSVKDDKGNDYSVVFDDEHRLIRLLPYLGDGNFGLPKTFNIEDFLKLKLTINPTKAIEGNSEVKNPYNIPNTVESAIEMLKNLGFNEMDTIYMPNSGIFNSKTCVIEKIWKNNKGNIKVRLRSSEDNKAKSISVELFITMVLNNLISNLIPEDGIAVDDSTELTPTVLDYEVYQLGNGRLAFLNMQLDNIPKNWSLKYIGKDLSDKKFNQIIINDYNKKIKLITTDGLEFIFKNQYTLNQITNGGLDIDISTDLVKYVDLTNDEDFNDTEDRSLVTPQQIVDSIKDETITPSVSVINGKPHFKCRFYSFNTFETGVLLTNDNPPKIKSFDPRRIDSFNGLAQMLGTDHLKDSRGKDVDTYTHFLNLVKILRLNAFNSENKQEFEDKIKSLFGKGLYPLIKDFDKSEIKCTFVLHSLADTDSETGMSNNAGRPEDHSNLKNANEELLYTNPGQDSKYLRDRKTFSVIISQKKNGTYEDILELPLLTIANPITILLSLHDEQNPALNAFIDPNVLARAESLKGVKDPEIGLRFLMDLQANKNLIKIQSINDLIDMYLDITSDCIFKLTDNFGPWTLKSKGIVPNGIERGYTYGIDDLDWKPNFIDLKEALQNPMIRHSELLLAKEQDYHNPDGTVIKNVFKSGIAFIFVSTDLSLDTTLKLCDRYILELQNPNLTKKVSLVEVIPPMSDTSEYLRLLARLQHGAFKHGETTDSIGNKFTALKILKNMLTDDSIKATLTDTSKGYALLYQKDIDILEKFFKENEDKIPPEYMHQLITVDNVSGEAYYVALRILALIAYPDIRKKLFGGLLQSSDTGTNDIGEMSLEGFNAILKTIKEIMHLDAITYSPKKNGNTLYNNLFYKVNCTENYRIPGIRFTSNNSFSLFGKLETNQYELDLDNPMFEGKTLILTILELKKIKVVDGTEIATTDANLGYKHHNVNEVLGKKFYDYTLEYLKTKNIDISKEEFTEDELKDFDNNLKLKLRLKGYFVFTTNEKYLSKWKVIKDPILEGATFRNESGEVIDNLIIGLSPINIQILTKDGQTIDATVSKTEIELHNPTVIPNPNLKLTIDLDLILLNLHTLTQSLLDSHQFDRDISIRTKLNRILHTQDITKAQEIIDGLVSRLDIMNLKDVSDLFKLIQLNIKNQDDSQQEQNKNNCVGTSTIIHI